MNITDFLHTRLNEEEQVAKAATPGPWTAEIHHHRTSRAPVLFEVHPVAELEGDGAGGVTSEHNAAHIARHHPARALRQVAAHRTILAKHHPYEAGPYPHACRGCPHSPTDDPYTENINTCPDLCAIASIYNDHPHYLEATTP